MPPAQLLWNGTLDHGKVVSGDRLLDRELDLRVDLRRSNISARWAAEAPWLHERQLAELRAGDVLHEESLGGVDAGGRCGSRCRCPASSG